MASDNRRNGWRGRWNEHKVVYSRELRRHMLLLIWCLDSYLRYLKVGIIQAFSIFNTGRLYTPRALHLRFWARVTYPFNIVLSHLLP